MNLASITGFGVSLAVALSVLAAGCSSGGTPPVTDRSRIDNSTERQARRAASVRPLKAGRYRVVAGDTLYSIAWRYQRDFRDVAALNGIPAPFEIYPGQVLIVRGNAPKPAAKPDRKPARKPARTSAAPHPMASTRTKPQSGRPVSSTAGRNTSSSASPSASAGGGASVAKTPAIPSTGPVKLGWPSNGKRIRDFGSKPTEAGKPSGNMDFELPAGAAIRAAGAGEVVFARASLAGYRQFVILKHNDTWLSSYGFNAPLQVREGQKVAAGTTLATLGRGASGTPNERVLRFEVRKNGTAVNPATVIGR